jgi:predicted DNA-binding transcriptional regulator YafY
MAERFHISQRQAHRDIDYLRKQLGAPLEFDQRNRGYIYTEPFSLPLIVAGENDDLYSPVEEAFVSGRTPLHIPEADHVIIQSQIPYTATLEIKDKLTVLEMRSYIISDEGKRTFLCEFHNIDRFLCAIFTARSPIRIIEPDWLRDKLLHMAQKILTAHKD